MHIPSTINEIIENQKKLEMQINRLQLDATLILRELRAEEKAKKKAVVAESRRKNLEKARLNKLKKA